MSGTRKSPRKYTLNVTITEKAGGYDFKVAESERNKEALIESASSTFSALLTKSIAKLATDYCSQHPDIDKLEFYNEIVDDLSNKLEKSYYASLTRDTFSWLQKNQPQIYQVNADEFSKFLEGIE